MLFTQKPSDFNPKLEAAGCFVEVEGEILLLFRHSKKPHGETWGMPAGKIEKNESSEIAVIREVYEETGIHIEKSDLNYVAESYARTPEYDWVYHIFKIGLSHKPDVVVDLDSHIQYTWVRPLEALKLPLLPGTDGCIQLVYA